MMNIKHPNSVRKKNIDMIKIAITAVLILMMLFSSVAPVFAESADVDVTATVEEKRPKPSDPYTSTTTSTTSTISTTTSTTTSHTSLTISYTEPEEIETWRPDTSNPSESTTVHYTSTGNYPADDNEDDDNELINPSEIIERTDIEKKTSTSISARIKDRNEGFEDKWLTGFSDFKGGESAIVIEEEYVPLSEEIIRRIIYATNKDKYSSPDDVDIEVVKRVKKVVFLDILFLLFLLLVILIIITIKKYRDRIKEKKASQKKRRKR